MVVPSKTTTTHDSVLQGRLFILTAAVLYGTLTVAMRFLYSMPNPPSPAALTSCRAWITSIVFLLLPNPKSQSNKSVSKHVSYPRPFWTVGLEFALWSCGSFGLLTVGVRQTQSPIRASFLTQTSVVITPVLSLFVGQSIRSSVWIGCLLALLGLVILSTGGTTLDENAASLSPSAGDLMVLGGACCWSFYLLRAATIGRRYPAIQLQSSISKFRALVCTIWLLTSAISTYESSHEQDKSWLQVLDTLISGQWRGYKSSFKAWALLAYAAIGPGALASTLIQKGSQHVEASETNVIFCSEPIFTAFWSWLVLGQVASAREGVGGLLILTAALLASGTLDGVVSKVTCMLCGSREKAKARIEKED